MLSLLFIGTSSASPSLDRALPATALLFNGGWLLIDCGEGTSRELLRYPRLLPPEKLRGICLTHPHVDHIWGLSGVFWTLFRAKKGDSDPIPVFGSAQTLNLVKRTMVDTGVLGSARQGWNPQVVRPAEIGLRPFPDQSLRLRPFPTYHTEGSLGFFFDLPAERVWNREAFDYLDLTADQTGRIKRGESITLDDGSVITPDQLTLSMTDACSVALTGDIDGTRVADIAPHVVGVDVLVTETTYLDHETEMARTSHHAIMREAVELANQAQAKRLILTHVTPRNHEERAFWEIAQADLDLYHSNASVAVDGQEIEIVNS